MTLQAQGYLHSVPGGENTMNIMKGGENN